MVHKVFINVLWFAASLFLASCTQTADPIAPSKSPNPAETSKVPQAISDAKEIANGAPLEAGHIVFQGMVRPTKGGYDVRGVIVEGDQLPKALANAPGADAKYAEWFLGAIVRITGQVKKHEAAPPSPDGIVMQTRSGTWFEVEKIDSASVVKPAEMIAGHLVRSKGFFSVGEHLVSSQDVAWSLGPQGGQEGDRVRFYGQSRTVICEPNAQCLLEGSLPLFDVGRAERVR
jgi:hypothetical protein